MKYAPLYLTLLLSACGGGGSTGNTQSPPSLAQSGTVSRSAVARDTMPATTDADVRAAAGGNSSFAAALMATQPDGNLVFSPYSVTQAVAMIGAGAKGDTLGGIEKAMSFPMAQERYLPALNGLDQALMAKTGSGLPQISIDNAAWTERSYTLKASYLDVIARDFGAGVHQMDFVGAAEPARGIINSWVADHTQQRITNLLPQGAVSAATRLVLTNAIWFKADWIHPFDPFMTQPGVSAAARCSFRRSCTRRSSPLMK